MTWYLSFYIWTQWFEVLGNIHREKVTLNGQMITCWKVHRETMFILSAWKFPASLPKSCTSPEIMAPSSQDHSVCWKTFLFHYKGNVAIFFPIHQSTDMLWQNVNMVNLTHSCVRTKWMAVTHLWGMGILVAWREKENN